MARVNAGLASMLADGAMAALIAKWNLPPSVG
jgi:ABC-type amino acid transport substrate-binding protein